MTQAEKAVLNAIVQAIQVQTVKLDALERVLIDRGLILDGERDLREQDYLMAAIAELAQVRTAIANL